VIGELWDLDGFDREDPLEQLADASLLELDLAAGEVRLHDVLRRYLAETLGAEALRQAHAALIERWGDPQRTSPRWSGCGA
jgi:hypothetical protein